MFGNTLNIAVTQLVLTPFVPLRALLRSTWRARKTELAEEDDRRRRATFAGVSAFNRKWGHSGARKPCWQTPRWQIYARGLHGHGGAGARVAPLRKHRYAQSTY